MLCILNLDILKIRELINECVCNKNSYYWVLPVVLFMHVVLNIVLYIDILIHMYM